MTERDVHLPVAAQPSVDTLVDQAVRAEQLGYDRAWLPETWGRDAITTLTLMANRTDEIGVGSSVVNVFSRSPATLGQTAVTLQAVADGRFRLGVGPSGPILMEGWHGVDFERPLRRTREAVEVINLVTSGRMVDYDGDVFDLSGFRLQCDPPETRPQVDVAAMGPTAVEMTGRFADGWHAIFFSPDALKDRMGDLRRGADLGDRDTGKVRTVLSVTCCALEDGDRARDLARQHLAFYVGGMGDYYRDSLARQGYEDEAREISAAWARGERRRALAVIDDDVLDAFAAAGTPERTREELAKFAAVDGLDAVAVGFPRGADPDEIDATLAALALEDRG
jgi:coenzyme F420-dependent oxidoreductase